MVRIAGTRSILYSQIKRKYNDAMTSLQRGAIAGSLIVIVVLGIVAAAGVGVSIWALVNYNEQKTNVDGKIDMAVATAKKEQADSLEAKFAAREKDPNRQFVGPEDYGRVTFSYPKTWSVYIGRNVQSGGTFEAYLNPAAVQPITTSTQYALRVTIEEKDYDQVVASYNPSVKKGSLKASSVSVGGNNGTRLDGTFSTDIRGAAVIYKIRDKTLTIRTDADTFKPDFDALIATIAFNQ